MSAIAVASTVITIRTRERLIRERGQASFLDVAEFIWSSNEGWAVAMKVVAFGAPMSGALFCLFGALYVAIRKAGN
jgi:hypothetical protein